MLFTSLVHTVLKAEEKQSVCLLWRGSLSDLQSAFFLLCPQMAEGESSLGYFFCNGAHPGSFTLMNQSSSTFPT